MTKGPFTENIEAEAFGVLFTLLGNVWHEFIAQVKRNANDDHSDIMRVVEIDYKGYLGFFTFSLNISRWFAPYQPIPLTLPLVELSHYTWNAVNEDNADNVVPQEISATYPNMTILNTTVFKEFQINSLYESQERYWPAIQNSMAPFSFYPEARAELPHNFLVVDAKICLFKQCVSLSGMIDLTSPHWTNSNLLTLPAPEIFSKALVIPSQREATTLSWQPTIILYLLLLSALYKLSENFFKAPALLEEKNIQMLDVPPPVIHVENKALQKENDKPLDSTAQSDREASPEVVVTAHDTKRPSHRKRRALALLKQQKEWPDRKSKVVYTRKKPKSRRLKNSNALNLSAISAITLQSCSQDGTRSLDTTWVDPFLWPDSNDSYFEGVPSDSQMPFFRETYNPDFDVIEHLLLSGMPYYNSRHFSSLDTLPLPLVTDVAYASTSAVQKCSDEDFEDAEKTRLLTPTPLPEREGLQSLLPLCILTNNNHNLLSNSGEPIMWTALPTEEQGQRSQVSSLIVAVDTSLPALLPSSLPAQVAESPAIYSVPRSGNCCHSATILALMHGFLSKEIKEESQTATQLQDGQNNFFAGIESVLKHSFNLKAFVYTSNTVEEKFRQLLELPGINKCDLLEKVMVPAFKYAMATYLLSLDRPTINSLCNRALGGTTEQDQNTFIRYFQCKQDKPTDYSEYGGTFDHVVVEHMYHVRILQSSVNDERFTQRSEEELGMPAMIIQHMTEVDKTDHYQAVLPQGSALNVDVRAFANAVNTFFSNLRAQQELAVDAIARQSLATAPLTPAKATETAASILTTPQRPSSTSDVGQSPLSSNTLLLSTPTPTRLPSVYTPQKIAQKLDSRFKAVFDRTPVKMQTSKSLSEVVGEFENAMSDYYGDQSTKKQTALNTLMDIVSKLTLDLNVCAPVALAALAKLRQCSTNIRMDDVYPHLYTVLQAVLATGKNKLPAVMAAKDILKWLANPPTRVSDLANVQAYWVKSMCGSTDIPIEAALTTLVMTDHDRDCIGSASPHAPALLRQLTFVWSGLYRRGADETEDHTLERRRHVEAISVYALKNIRLNCTGGEPLTLEQQWLLVTAITDYDDASDHLTRHPKDHVRAISPFYNAIKLLALEQGKDSEEIRNELRDSFFASYEATDVRDLVRKNLQERMEERVNQLLERQSMLERELMLERESRIQQSSSNALVTMTPSSTASGLRSTTVSPDTDTHSIASDPSVSTSASAFYRAWKKLDTKYGSLGRSLNKVEIITILQFFDATCQATAATDRNNMMPLLTKAFESMKTLFDAEITARSRWSLFSFKGEPTDFKELMNAIAPQPEIPAYMFAQFCVFQANKGTALYEYEENFIRAHIPRLYACGDCEALETMTVYGKSLRFYVAPIDAVNIDAKATKKSAIGLIYPRLNTELKLLEAKKVKGQLTKEDVAPYQHLSCVKVSELVNDKNVGQRVNVLIEAVQKNTLQSSMTITIARR